MKRLLLAATVAGLLIAPSTAQAVPYLGYGEAARVIGSNLHRGFEYGAETGSLATDCWRLARNRVRCYISFVDLDGDSWCGEAGVRENRAFYRTWRKVHTC